MMLKIKLDTNLCSGHARCAALSPDVFELDDSGYCLPQDGPVSDELKESILRGVRACPERALELIEE